MADAYECVVYMYACVCMNAFYVSFYVTVLVSFYVTVYDDVYE